MLSEKAAKAREEASILLAKGKEKEAKILLCKNDLKFLCKEVLGYKDWDTIHDDLQYFLDTNTSSKKLILFPRGHLKSSVVTKGFSIQCILNNPNIRILIANAIWDYARGFLRTIKLYLESYSILPKLFGDFKTSTKNSNVWASDSIIINQRTLPLDAPTIATTGVDRAQASQHYDIIILDDVVIDKNCSTKNLREKVKMFYLDCLNLLEPDGMIIVIGTTWHEDDLYNTLQNNENFAIFKRIAEQGTEESVIFKKKFTLAKLWEKKKEGAVHYAAQYLLNPYPEEEMEFKKHWIQYFEELPREPLYVSMTLDPSLGKEVSDFAALVTTGISSDNKKYVLGARRFKCKVDLIPQEIVREVNTIRSKYGIEPHVLGIEAFAFQEVLYEPIRRALKEAKLKTYAELLPKEVINQKEGRILYLVTPFSNLEVFVHKTQTDLLDELLRWRRDRTGKSDDLIDALAWQMYFWNRKPNKAIVAQNKEYTMEWWLNHNKDTNNTDLFNDFKLNQGEGSQVRYKDLKK
jgi:hypothetical protein